MIALEPLTTREDMAWAQAQVAAHHYLHTRVPRIARPEGYAIVLPAERCGERVGCLIVCRTQSTAFRPWYGSLEDVIEGRCEVTRWQVLNLARVWLDPRVQVGGDLCAPGVVPGFTDRRGRFRPTVASAALALLAERVGYDYLLRRPPVFPDEPYEVRWLLSYQDRRLHRGTIYAAAGWELVPSSNPDIATWRVALPPLSLEQHGEILAASAADPRGRKYRAERERETAQLALALAP